jgi:ACT domain-containing protein
MRAMFMQSSHLCFCVRVRHCVFRPAKQHAAVSDRMRAGVQVIKKHKNCHQQYVDGLLSDAVVTEDEVQKTHDRIQKIMQARTYRVCCWLSLSL